MRMTSFASEGKNILAKATAQKHKYYFSNNFKQFMLVSTWKKRSKQ
jgi:hypothetical protein